MNIRFGLLIFLLALSVQSQTLNTKVIYTTDTRQEIAFEKPTEIMNFIQKRTLAIVHNAKLFYQPSGDILLMPRHYGRAFKLCEDERFFNQPSLPSCTASVISKNLVLTAGHCISEESCPYLRFVADFVMQDEDKNPIRTDFNKIYSCKRVIYDNNTVGSDMAIIEIDRDFSHSPLDIAEQLPSATDEFLAVGFPSGLPMKSSGLGRIRTMSDQVINAELDTYGGNSGSPVFKKNSSVIEGILVAGEDDFVKIDEPKQCYRSKVCDSTSCIGEDIITGQFIKSVFDKLKATMN